MKDAFKSEGLLCSVVCLYRLTDVPEIVSELGHTDEALLVRRLGEIITMFNPDDPYWYRDPTTCIGTLMLVNAVKYGFRFDLKLL